MKTKEREKTSVASASGPVRKRRARAEAERVGAATGWDAIEKLVGTVHGPADLAVEHDHYARGTPKRGKTAQP
jgi:hypothetical protein